MNRVVGIETEYGCLVSGDPENGRLGNVGGVTSGSGYPGERAGPATNESWPTRIKNHAFGQIKIGAIDLHYRDYEEPPGNGGFLLNGGRLYVDMGHLEYSTPECKGLEDAVAYEQAGDILIQSVLEGLGVEQNVAIIKNNIDHHTGATFGCHENYLMKRHLQFNPRVLGTLLSFLATRQLFTGAGRVGQARPVGFGGDGMQVPREDSATRGVDFQISQRADHIVNDIYQWVQFNRAIINARDEPLADYRKYRRLHLLIGDSNMSPFATALKLGTTALVLTLLEEGLLPSDVVLKDAVSATQIISHAGTGEALVELEDGRTRQALDIQEAFHEHARKHLAHQDTETDWILDTWQYTLRCLRTDPELLIGGVDWISKKWLLEAFMEEEGLTWQDPWLQSIDLEYHNIDPNRGLAFAVKAPKTVREFNRRVRRNEALRNPPADTRACGRGAAVKRFMQGCCGGYVINWDSISIENKEFLAMPDPFDTYVPQVEALEVH